MSPTLKDRTIPNLNTYLRNSKYFQNQMENLINNKFLQSKLTSTSIIFILFLSIIVFIPVFFTKDFIVDTVIYDVAKNNILYRLYKILCQEQ